MASSGPTRGTPARRSTGTGTCSASIRPTVRCAPSSSTWRPPTGSPSPRTSRSCPSPTPRPARPGGHSIHAYDVFEGRHAKNGRSLVEVSPGLPDGFRVDTDGNLWSSSLTGIQVFTPGGEELGEIPVPEKVANCCFGGADGR